MEMFVYQWSSEEEETTKIKIYGINEKKENVCLRIENFTPYVYIELPNDSKSTINVVTNTLKNYILSTKIIYKTHLYNSFNNAESSPFLFCQCESRGKINQIIWKLKNGINIPSEGLIMLKTHEQNATSILQLVSLRNISMSGWLFFDGEEIFEDKHTSCCREYIVKWKKLNPNPKLDLVHPKCLAFDLEVNSEIVSAMPDNRPDDTIFQISCVDDEKRQILLVLKCDDLVDGFENELLIGVDVRIFETEEFLLLGFIELIRKEKPNVMTGYNILGFDIQYLIRRCERYFLSEELKFAGFNQSVCAEERTIKWSSSAFKNQEYSFIDWEGILLIDLLPIVKRDYKLDNYKLETVSNLFLGAGKDPITPKDIFESYRSKKMAAVGKYCIRDSDLCIDLMQYMHCWIGLSEMAKVCNVSMFTLYTQGQQIKIYSQVYKYCLHNNIIVTSNGYVASANERYTGAYVFEPVPGYYNRVVPLDFCLAGDTLVSLANGMSKRIDKFSDKEELVLGWGEKGIGSYKNINGLQKKGFRDTVKITLQDGRTITATPEHKFMLHDGSYCQASNLKGKKVKCGPINTEDIVGDDEKGWTLENINYTFKMEGDEREIMLALSRVLGFVLADGSLYICKNRPMAEAYFGTLFDAERFISDIALITSNMKNKRKQPIKIPTPRIRTGSKGTYIRVCIPAAISHVFASLDGMIIGKRATQNMTLPTFLLDNCPKSVIREFLAGLFGGDGVTPYLSNKILTPMRFKWDTLQIHQLAMEKTFHDLNKLIEKVSGIKTTILGPHLLKTPKAMAPKDGLPRVYFNLGFPTGSEFKFQKYIGFRFCINKSNKLYIASSYVNMCNQIREKYNEVFERTNELIYDKIPNSLARIAGQPTISDCLKQAKTEILTNCILPIHPMSQTQFLSARNNLKRYPERPRKINMKQKFDEFVKEIGAAKWFQPGAYSVKTKDTHVPSINLTVLDVSENGKEEVFDIEVKEAHNFICGGVLASNCSLYPSLIIAYNICYSTIAGDDVANDKCNVFEWEDHVGCQHDSKVIKTVALTTKIDEIETEIKTLRITRDSSKGLKAKKEIQKEINQKKISEKPFREKRVEMKKSRPIDKEDFSGNKISGIICAKRNYKFLKSEIKKGVIPIIIQNLLDSRKIVKGKLKTADDSTRIILDKEQLAYKVSANSMYGAMGVRRGYLPFMPGAMCVTYTGRSAIEKTAKLIQDKWGGEIIYGEKRIAIKELGNKFLVSI